MESEEKQKEVQEIIKEMQEAFQVQEEVEEQIRNEQGRCQWFFQKVFHNKQAKELLAKRTLDQLDINKQNKLQ